MEISELHKLFQNSAGVNTDSRNITPNSIFFALKGANFNGNKYAESALEDGALYAVVDEKEYCKAQNCILVDDVLTCLQKLANYHRKQLSATFIGITGTNGKTTTKELIASVLSAKYKTAFTKGNLNNHIGVPLTLLSISADTEFAIIEMGANHLGEIAELCEICEPDYGIITNIGQAHLEGFGSFENIIETKTALYRWIKQNGKGIFINADDELLLSHTNSAVASYSSCKEDADTMVNVAEMNPFLKVSHKEDIQTQLFGEYNLYNIAASICIGEYFSVPFPLLKDALENYSPQNNRSQITKTANNTLFIDAYNANPSSMAVAIKNFGKLNLPSKQLILGEMFELGNDHKQKHIEIEELAYNEDFEKVILAGNWPQSIKSEKIIYLIDTNEVKSYLEEKELKAKNILLKGSRGMKLETLIPLL